MRSVQGAPRSYAEYLAAGGTPGPAYRSYGQLLQEAVLAIAGARDAYLSGASSVPALQRIREAGEMQGQGIGADVQS